MEPRKNTNKIIEVLEELYHFNDKVMNLIISLLFYMSDEDAKDWAIQEAYMSSEDFEPVDEKEDVIVQYCLNRDKKQYEIKVKNENDEVILSTAVAHEQDISTAVKSLKDKYNVLQIKKITS